MKSKVKFVVARERPKRDFGLLRNFLAEPEVAESKDRSLQLSFLRARPLGIITLYIGGSLLSKATNPSASTRCRISNNVVSTNSRT